MAQSIRVFAPQAEIRCSNPSRDRPKSLKQVLTSFLLNARLGECHEMTIINDVPFHSRCDMLKTLTAQWLLLPSIKLCQNLHPFTGNGDVCISHKQTNKQTNKQRCVKLTLFESGRFLMLTFIKCCFYFYCIFESESRFNQMRTVFVHHCT